ncbi:hypothetical protein GCM10011594_19520 [Nakamurella endophytica]|uniref:Uncharacterized protein n=2 Tax=Nakamurella endophytica TaxID=1748367 RepID=A0A917WFY7_9ACTN|nr:hypothetical protein GCM10011594_19520 [Nakamurella endophytica]
MDGPPPEDVDVRVPVGVPPPEPAEPVAVGVDGDAVDPDAVDPDDEAVVAPDVAVPDGLGWVDGGRDRVVGVTEPDVAEPDGTEPDVAEPNVPPVPDAPDTTDDVPEPVPAAVVGPPEPDSVSTLPAGVSAEVDGAPPADPLVQPASIRAAPSTTAKAGDLHRRCGTGSSLPVERRRPYPGRGRPERVNSGAVDNPRDDGNRARGAVRARRSGGWRSSDPVAGRGRTTTDRGDSPRTTTRCARGRR